MSLQLILVPHDWRNPRLPIGLACVSAGGQRAGHPPRYYVAGLAKILAGALITKVPHHRSLWARREAAGSDELTLNPCLPTRPMWAVGPRCVTKCHEVATLWTASRASLEKRETFLRACCRGRTEAFGTILFTKRRRLGVSSDSKLPLQTLREVLGRDANR